MNSRETIKRIVLILSANFLFLAAGPHQVYPIDPTSGEPSVSTSGPFWDIHAYVATPVELAFDRNQSIPADTLTRIKRAAEMPRELVPAAEEDWRQVIRRVSFSIVKVLHDRLRPGEMPREPDDRQIGDQSRIDSIITVLSGERRREFVISLLAVLLDGMITARQTEAHISAAIRCVLPRSQPKFESGYAETNKALEDFRHWDQTRTKLYEMTKKLKLQIVPEGDLPRNKQILSHFLIKMFARNSSVWTRAERERFVLEINEINEYIVRELPPDLKAKLMKRGYERSPALQPLNLPASSADPTGLLDLAALLSNSGSDLKRQYSVHWKDLADPVGQIIWTSLGDARDVIEKIRRAKVNSLAQSVLTKLDSGFGICRPLLELLSEARGLPRETPP